MMTGRRVVQRGIRRWLVVPANGRIMTKQTFTGELVFDSFNVSRHHFSGLLAGCPSSTDRSVLPGPGGSCQFSFPSIEWILEDLDILLYVLFYFIFLTAVINSWLTLWCYFPIFWGAQWHGLSFLGLSSWGGGGLRAPALTHISLAELRWNAVC